MCNNPLRIDVLIHQSRIGKKLSTETRCEVTLIAKASMFFIRHSTIISILHIFQSRSPQYVIAVKFC